MILDLPVELLSRIAHSATLWQIGGSQLAAQDKQSAIAAVAQISMLPDLITLNNFEHHSHLHRIAYLIK